MTVFQPSSRCRPTTEAKKVLPGKKGSRVSGLCGDYNRNCTRPEGGEVTAVRDFPVPQDFWSFSGLSSLSLSEVHPMVFEDRCTSFQPDEGYSLPMV